MYLAFCSGGLAGNRVQLRSEKMLVGRASKNDIRLTPKDTTSSGTHATLEQVDGAWFVRDERSTTGTFVNGRRIQPNTTTAVHKGDWIMFGASGPAALLQASIDSPPRTWLVVEPKAYPGRFLAAADRDEVRIALDRDGLLLEGAQAREGRTGLAVHLDRNPIVAEPAGGDATVRQDDIATGHILEVGDQQLPVRVLGARGAPPKEVPKVGVGQQTLKREVIKSGRKNQALTLALVGLACAGLIVAGYSVLDMLAEEREQDRAEIADVSGEVSEVSGELSEVERRHAEDRAKDKAEREKLMAQLDEMRASFSNSFERERERFQRALEAQQAELKRALAEANASERERFAELLERYKRSVFLIYTVTTFNGVQNRDGSPVRTAGWGTGWLATSSGLLVTNKHVVEDWKFDENAQALLARFPNARPDTEIYAWPADTSFLDSSNLPPNTQTGFNTARRGNLRLLGVATDDWTGRFDKDFGGRTVRIRTHKVVSDGDLAVLRLSGSGFTPIPIKRDPTTMKNLDAVMLLGFPLGARVIDSGRSDLSASLGTIRFVTGDVKHTASSFGGNSGGPLLSMDGEVVGVHSRSPVTGGGGGAETFGMAIRSDVVLRFLRGYR